MFAARFRQHSFATSGGHFATPIAINLARRRRRLSFTQHHPSPEQLTQPGWE